MRTDGYAAPTQGATMKAGATAFPKDVNIQAGAPPARYSNGTTATTTPRASLGDGQVERLAEQLRHRTLSPYERFAKPVIDRAAAAILLILLSPALIAIGLGIRLAMGRPVLFGQRRAGHGGAPFTMLKFRTMLLDRRLRNVPVLPECDRRVTHKSRSDPRHTTLGRWLRKTSLDELPQLIHVLRGQMSLVGPRPELIALVNDYAPWQQTRHIVKPGVTGLWQTTERGDGRMLHECTRLDLEYIANISLRLDLLILLRTPFALLRNKGVI